MRSIIIVLLCFVTGILSAQKTKQLGEQSITKEIKVELKKNALITWITPARNPIYEKGEYLNLTVNIEAPFRILEDNIQVFLNGDLYTGDGKAGEAELKPTRNNYIKVYSRKIRRPKKAKESSVFIILRSPKGEITRSKPTVFHHTDDIIQPSLFLLSVGVNQFSTGSGLPNLKYAEADARSFRDAFQNQTGLNRIFKNFSYKELLTGNEVSKIKYKVEIRRLKNMYLNGDIKKQDVLVFFISSHGVAGDNGDVLIATPEYQKGFEEDANISINKHIIKELEDVDCKKIVFLDACFSGGPAEGKASPNLIGWAIEEIQSAPSGVFIFASSKGDQKSYELDKYKHGSFTQGILEGMVEGKSDKNNDDIITFTELFDYVEKRVPKLNKENGKKVQNPSRSSGSPLGRLSFFVID